MPRYQVVGRVVYQIDLEVEAASLEEAIQDAEDFHFITAVNDAAWAKEEIEVEDALPIDLN